MTISNRGLNTEEKMHVAKILLTTVGTPLSVFLVAVAQTSYTMGPPTVSETSRREYLDENMADS